jgi:hypothetical protein
MRNWVLMNLRNRMANGEFPAYSIFTILILLGFDVCVIELLLPFYHDLKSCMIRHS